MRASTDQVRNATVDAVDAARHRASGLVSTGADLVTTTLDKGASVVEGGIERVAEKAPMVSVGGAEQKESHRLRTTLIAVAVLLGVLAVARTLQARRKGQASGPATPTDAPGPGTTDDEDAEPVAAGSG